MTEILENVQVVPNDDVEAAADDDDDNNSTFSTKRAD